MKCLSVMSVLVGLAACADDTPVCEGLPSGATLALTPRADTEVERLALRCSDALVASQARYDTLLADLDAITVVRGARPRSYGALVGSELLIVAPSERIERLRSGANADFDCLNTQLHGRLFADDDSLVISFPGALGSDALAATYARVLGDDAEVFPDAVAGDGDSIQFDLRGSPHRYLVSLGSGDCPSGCINWSYELWQVDAGDAHLQAAWDKAADAPAGFQRADFECP